MAEQNRMEQSKAEGGQLIDQIKRLVHEGNVRRIVIKQGERTVVEFPLTIGVVGGCAGAGTRCGGRTCRAADATARSRLSENRNRCAQRQSPRPPWMACSSGIGRLANAV